jgi:hypothetical protein
MWWLSSSGLIAIVIVVVVWQWLWGDDDPGA